MYRQVLIEGVAHRVDARESDVYFASRPHDSQVAAWSSHQSATIENRAALDAQFDAALAKFEGTDVPRPEYWGGYRIVPTRIEFWKGRSNRMHDRIVFERSVDEAETAGEWIIGRLQP